MLGLSSNKHKNSKLEAFKMPIWQKEGKELVPSTSRKVEGLLFLTFATNPKCSQERGKARRSEIESSKMQRIKTEEL